MLYLTILLAALCLLLAATVLLVWRASQSGQGVADPSRPLIEQILAVQRAESESRTMQTGALELKLSNRFDTLRLDLQTTLSDARMAQNTQLSQMAARSTQEAADLRLLLEVKQRELAEMQALKLTEIQASVNEQLHKAVERQMETSFQRVIEQFSAVQKAMGDVQAVTAQIGDLRRIFTNVKSRGGWGETQLRIMLDDILPAGSYDTNRKLRDASDDAVEFALHMPMRGDQRPMLAIDAKFPVEDYSRLLDAAEAGDVDQERAARRGLETRIRAEAKKIGSKYICPPVTVEFAVMYLATDGLYAEAARCPGLIEEVSRIHKVLILGPSLLPALLRTIQLGFVTLALEQKADEIRGLLGATRTEMIKMDDVLDKLGEQAGRFSATIDKARTRTRVMQRKLKSVEAIETEQAAALLGIEPDPSILESDFT